MNNSIKRIISLNLFIILLVLFVLSSVAASGPSVNYSIEVGDTAFTSDTSSSGTGWSYDGATNTLTLDGYNGDSIKASGDLTVYVKSTSTVSGTDASPNGITANGVLNINAEAPLTVNGANGNFSNGGDAVFAYDAKISTKKSGSITFNGGNSTMLSGGVGLKANNIELSAEKSEINGGNNSSAVFFIQSFEVKNISSILFTAGTNALNAISFLKNGTYTFEDGLKITFEDGNKKISVIPSSEIIYGDINDDGKIDTKDAVILAQYLAKWKITFTARNSAAADCNADGIVDIIDAVLLAQYLAKWEVTLGPVALN